MSGRLIPIRCKVYKRNTHPFHTSPTMGKARNPSFEPMTTRHAHKRQGDEMEDERALRIRRETAEVVLMELQNTNMWMEGIKTYRHLLGIFGLDNEPNIQQAVLDAVSNAFVSSPDGFLTASQCKAKGLESVLCTMESEEHVLDDLFLQNYQTEFGVKPSVTIQDIDGELRMPKSDRKPYRDGLRTLIRT